MTITFASASDQKQWDSHILANPDGGNIFQSSEFAGLKRLGGWTARYIMAGTIALTILEKPVLGLGKLWYVPKGPGITTVRQLDDLLLPLRQFAADHGVFAIKIEPELPLTDETVVDLMKLGLHKVSPIQPNFSTVLLDISGSTSDIMASLNQKGRHAIKRAERDGVTVAPVPITDKNCQTMYRLLATTAEGSFRIRHYDYYRTFWQRYQRVDMGQLFFAYVDGQVVAGAYALVFGTKSTYKDGASVRQRTVYGASHLLQWHVIQWAKEKGSLVHDFCGSPPSDQIKNPDHPHYGIGRFKTSFNKDVTDYVGAYDIVIKPMAYKIWAKFGERIVTRLYAARHHENWY